MKDVKPEELAAAEAQWKKANPGKEPTSEDISKQVYQTAYDKAFNESGFGTGGQVQRAIQAATAAVQGLAGGDMAAALANGAAPYITKMIADSLPNDPAARTLAHAAVNAALAAAQGNNVLVGAGGAVTGELLGMIAVNAYGKPVSELSESEKQTVSALATLAAGLAGGLIGDSTADVVAGAQTGKTVVENNFLSVTQLDNFAQKARTCEGAACQQVIQDMVETNLKQQKEMLEFCSSQPDQCGNKYGYLVDQWDVFDKAIKQLDADGKLPNEFKNYLSAVYSSSMEAEGTVANLGWQQKFEALGLDKDTAAAMAATIPALINAKGSKVGKGATGTTTNGYKVSNGADKVVAKTELEHPIVQSRINVQNGNSKQGWEHVVQRHFSDKNASQFTISQSEVKTILQSNDVSKVPISRKIESADGPRYERVITLDKSIGIDKFSGKPTNTMTILTDGKGNLITTTPGRIK
jgi:filamentous hemagglutinin